MRRGATGKYVTISTAGGERARAFVPESLPPDPPLLLDGPLREKLDESLLALGRLDSVSTLLPDTHLFLYMYVRKEAVLSSQIEGTRSTLSDLLLFEAEEAPGVPIDDVVEVSNYVAAMEHGLKRLRSDLPLSNRLIKEIHGKLLRSGRGAEKDPGNFRRSQNWLGGSRPGNARFVPPPAAEVPELMGRLEKWLHDIPERTSPLLKAALGHVQFETIHPFLDGNGRVGRLLITLLLCAEGVLREPLLYLSLYLKERRDAYYDLLTRVREDGDWEAWVEFFADGVRESAALAAKTAQRLVARGRGDEEQLRQLGRRAGSALRVHRAFMERPLANASQLIAATKLSPPAVLKSLDALQEAGLVSEITGRRRNRVYRYTPYLAILSEGTRPLG